MSEFKKYFDQVDSGEMTVDWGGHHRGRVATLPKGFESIQGKYMPEKILAGNVMRADLVRRSMDLWESFSKEAPDLSEEQVLSFERFYERDAVKMADYMPVEGSFLGSHCYDCGETPVLALDGNLLTATQRCQHPSGHPEYGPTIKFPTGEVLFADSLLGEPLNETICLEGERGGLASNIYQTMGAGTADFGLGYCGSSDPSVYLREDRKEILIISTGYNDEEFVLEGYTEVGAIDTGQWWWSIADRTVVEQKAKELDTYVNDDGSAQVEPGSWQVFQRHHLGHSLPMDDYPSLSPRPGHIIHARLEWLGK